MCICKFFICIPPPGTSLHLTLRDHGYRSNASCDAPVFCFFTSGSQNSSAEFQLMLFNLFGKSVSVHSYWKNVSRHCISDRKCCINSFRISHYNNHYLLYTWITSKIILYAGLQSEFVFRRAEQHSKLSEYCNT